MTIGDIGVLAEAIEKCLPEIAKNNSGEDIRNRLKILINVSDYELNQINKELYEMTNHTSSDDNLTSVGAIELDVVGIIFVCQNSVES